MALHRTLAQLTTSVRRFLDEASAAFWADLDLHDYINQAKDRCINEVRKLKDDYGTITRTSLDGALTILGESYSASSMALPVGTSTLVLPHDVLEIKLIECISSSYEHVRFFHRDLNHPDMRRAMSLTSNVGPGSFYFDVIGERSLRIAPKSDTALDLQITYVQQFPDLSAAGDELTMPFPLYLAVIHFATASAMMQDNNANAAAHEARATKIVADMFGAHARQTQDQEVVSGAFEDY